MSYTIKNTLLTLLCFSFLLLNSRLSAQVEMNSPPKRISPELSAIKNFVQQQQDPQKIRALSNQYKQADNQKRKALEAFLKTQGKILLKDPQLHCERLDESGLPEYWADDNLESAKRSNVDEVQPGGGLGLGLSAKPILLGIWESGGIPNKDHVEFKGRLSLGQTTGISSHATHVAGTMIATGINPNAKGMAFEGSLVAYNSDSRIPEMLNEANNNGMLVSNHSYGEVCGWRRFSGPTSDPSDDFYRWFGSSSLSELEDFKFGYYSNETKGLDDLSYNTPFHLICKSAGNDRADNWDVNAPHFVFEEGKWVESTQFRQPDGTGNVEGGFDCITPSASAKNILTVGNLEGFTTLRASSNVGPTDDGRIKPDLVADGSFVFSSDYSSSSASPNTVYGTKSGTSMAGPVAAGSAALMQDYYIRKYGQVPLASTIKGLLLHTATDLGNPGPDFTFGWGRLDAEKAAEVIQNRNRTHEIYEGGLATNASSDRIVYTNGNAPLRVTICWTDRAGTVHAPAVDNPAAKLVNNLDLELEKLDGADAGTVYRPYILDRANPGNNATTGKNVVDNVEQVYLAFPSAGHYRIRTEFNGGLANDYQNFSTVVSGAAFDFAPLPYYTEFDGGFDLHWDTNHGSGGSSFIGSFSSLGSKALILQPAQNGQTGTSAAIVKLNMAGKTDVQLSFTWTDFNESLDALDGIYLSNNGGATYTKIWFPFTSVNTDWEFETIDISGMAQALGMTLNSNMVIKFQQRGSNRRPNGGLGFGKISVTEGVVPTTLPYENGFENGLDEHWVTSSSTSQGRILPTTVTTSGGTNLDVLAMDVMQNRLFNRNEAKLHLDLTGHSNVKCFVHWLKHGDEFHAGLDGIFFSDDGGSTFTLIHEFDGPSTGSNGVTLDVDQLCADNGLVMNERFVIKLQQFDNFPRNFDGISFNTIRVEDGEGPSSKGDNLVLNALANIPQEDPSPTASLGLTVFPNPVNQHLKVTTDYNGTSPISLDLIDLSGIRIKQMKTPANGGMNTWNLDVSNLPAGIYFVRMRAGKQVKTQKVIVAH